MGPGKKLTLFVILFTMCYVGIYMDPVMFWIQDLRETLLGQ